MTTLTNNNKEIFQLSFKKVFCNIVLVRNIYKYVRLYNKNECIKFKSRKELIEYKEREYISQLIYYGVEMLTKGDLPTYGVLKQVKLKEKELALIKGDAIPYGTEILEYCKHLNFSSLYETKRETTPFSTLPPTIHTIKSATILVPSHYNLQQQQQESQEPQKVSSLNSNSPIFIPYSQRINNNNIEVNKGYIQIPSNITSISFATCPHISSGKNKGDRYLIIPNTVKELSFNCIWSTDLFLRKGDIPNSVTSLSMPYYKGLIKSNTILPNSIKHLKIAFDNGTFNFLPSNIESLYIKTYSNITKKSNLFQNGSIKNLTVYFYFNDTEISEYSLPQSSNLIELVLIQIRNQIKKNVIPKTITNLSLLFAFKEHSDDDIADDMLGFEISKGAIPNSVTSLKLDIAITQPNILPSSLTSLEVLLNENRFHYLPKMISILPPSLTTLKLPLEFKNHSPNITFPSTIINLIYQ